MDEFQAAVLGEALGEGVGGVVVGEGIDVDTNGVICIGTGVVTKAYVDAGDAATLVSANAYTDGEVSAEAALRIAGDLASTARCRHPWYG